MKRHVALGGVVVKLILGLLVIRVNTAAELKEPSTDLLVDGERRIKNKLLQHYDSSTRPVKIQNSTIRVSLGMSLFHILETQWRDEYIQWNPNEYGGISQIWIPSQRIWRPDITINNNADQQFDSGSGTNSIIKSNGSVLWMFPAVVKTTCSLDVRYFPFDEQHCSIMLISWTYSGQEVDLIVDGTNPTANYFKEQNQEWHIKDIVAIRTERHYACCANPYPDVTFVMMMERRSTFYVMNLVAPCALLYAVSFLSFYLPVESGDKVSVEITILLAIVVFLMVVADTLPPTPDAIPLLGAFFEVTMFMIAVALTMSVIVTNLYYRKDYGRTPPRWLRKLFLSNPRAKNAIDNTPNQQQTGDHQHNSIEIFPPVRPQRRRSTLFPLLQSRQQSVDINHDDLSSQTRTTFTNTSHLAGCPHYVPASIVNNSVNSTPIPPVSTVVDGSPDDWRRIAIALDRVFFYIFTSLSIVAFLSVFLRLIDKDHEDVPPVSRYRA